MNNTTVTATERPFKQYLNIYKVPDGIANYTVVWTRILHIDDVSFGIIIACLLVHALLLLLLLRAIARSWESDLVKARLKIYTQLVLCMIAFYITLLVIAQEDLTEGTCFIVSVVIDFVLLAPLSFLIMQNISVIIDLKQKRHKALTYILVGWGVPLFVVLLTVVCHYYAKELFSNELCWLKVTSTLTETLAQIVPFSTLLLVMLATIPAVNLLKVEGKTSKDVMRVARTSNRMNASIGLPLVIVIISYDIWMLGSFGVLMEYITVCLVLIQCLINVLVLLIFEHSVKNSLMGEAREEYQDKLRRPPTPKASGIRYVP